MLSTLHIENIAVIEQATINFENGFNVLTGETGAGKSIIIDSIGAILGFRTSKELIRYGSNKGFVSAIFTDISNKLKDLLDEMGLLADDENSLIIQREISENGKNNCRINMRPVQASTLKILAPYLINIHGQHDGGMLLNAEYHIDFLDDYCKNTKILNDYNKIYSKLISIKRTIKNIEKDEAERQKTIERLSYEIEELTEAKLKIGEEEQLTKAKERLDSLAKITYALSFAHDALYGYEESDGAYNAVSSASKMLSAIANISDEYQSLYNKMETLKYSMEEIVADISTAEDLLDSGEDNFENIEQRLDFLYKLRLKYGKNIEELIDYTTQAENELNSLTSVSQNKEELLVSYRENLQKARELSAEITKRRCNNAINLEKQIIQSLSGLDMDKISFKINIDTVQTLSAKGSDKVEFLISTNAGETLKPLSKIASGGELSRIMLAIKGVLADGDIVDTMIFDEIDTGVSGRAAQKIGYRLWQLSNKRQVLCVTHLAQIAAVADRQYSIEKSTLNDRTYTNINELDAEKRKNELARIIAGDNITETSLKTAEELIEKSNIFKIQNR